MKEYSDNTVEIIFDSVNKPKHYADRKHEPIEVMIDWAEANKLPPRQAVLYRDVIKYLSRYNLKGDPKENLQKAQYYLNRLLKEVEDAVVKDL